MSKKNYILMVFEGELTEKIIFNSLKKYFLKNKTNRIIYGFHCGEIYSLYNKLQKPENETLFYILKNKNPELEHIIEEYVESIYLFFDYDNHAPTADDTKLQKMLDFFDDEFENGKLFISYPMVEAIKHLQENINFEETIEKSCKKYKKIVSQNCDKKLENLNDLTKENWEVIINEHLKKANFIVYDSFELPNSLIDQIEIFENQKLKYINIDNKVAVLSSFPLFLLDYYGLENIQTNKA